MLPPSCTTTVGFSDARKAGSLGGDCRFGKALGRRDRAENLDLPGCLDTATPETL